MLRPIIIALIFINLTWLISCTFEEKARQYISDLPKNYKEVSILLKENYEDAAEIWKDICKKSKPSSVYNKKKVHNIPKSFDECKSIIRKINSNVDNFLVRKMVHGSPPSAKKPKRFGGKLVKFLYENKYFGLLISIAFLVLVIASVDGSCSGFVAIGLFMIFITTIISLILFVKIDKIEKKYYHNNSIIEVIMNYFKKIFDFIL
ncbi:Plasmodium exported protein, unknown function [Plasmodium vivax]|uniref:Lipoprotein n=1 Tax=Plasmodium vivax TaxID=5855 RepID=A0A565A2M9_PLAVI|nr:Plasmodium exported protein, unknown function [Plasmodium vivax]